MSLLDGHQAMRDALVEEGLIFATGVDGVYAHSETFERILGALDARVRRWGVGLGATMLHLPPVLPRTTFDATDYVRAFPDLMGSVHVFEGSNREHAELLRRLERGEDWSHILEPAELVLAPALCHFVYPMCSGEVPPGGVLYEATGSCFRHEPSVDPTRLQTFRLHEVVYVGEPEQALQHRDQALAAGVALLRQLGLQVSVVPANDPFFGRLGAALAAEQYDEGLKFEGVAPVVPGAKPTALLSSNYHRDHFGAPFGIRTATGEVAHSACIGFGTDRIALALLAQHGLDPADWPAQVTEELFG
jgi:seryl-tRNA synthetase